MLERIIQEINSSLENGCFVSALALGLTLPDICGKAEYPSLGNTTRYIKWYNIHIGNNEKPSDPYGTDMPYASGEVIYNLRNSLLHQGTPNITASDVKEERCKVDKFILSISDDYDSGTSMVAYGAGMKIVKRELKINIRHLCYLLCDAASKYYDVNKEKFNFFDYELIDERSVVG